MCLGIPGRIVAVADERRKLATVDVCGVTRTVNIACIVDAEHSPASCVGQWVVVHVGFAMSRIDEHEAAETLKLLAELGEAQAEIEAMRVSGLEAVRRHPYGACATTIGRVVARPAGTVLLETVMGGRRVVDMLVGDQLPRIC